MNTFLVICLLISFGLFEVKSSPVTCNPNNKIRYGQFSDTEQTCIDRAGCYDSETHCYLSQDYIPGFRAFRGPSNSVSEIRSYTNKNRFGCSRECLKENNCLCFTFNRVTKVCSLKNSFCTEGSPNDDNILVHNRYAYKNLICAFGDCSGNDISTDSTLADCSTNCVGTCEMFILSNGECHRKSSLCNFIEEANLRSELTACLKGPAFPDWSSNHFINRNDIIDISDTTCKDVNLETTFHLKVGWPTVGTSKTDFQLEIVGKNMRRCMNSTGETEKNFIAAFTVLEFQYKPLFTGNFKACKLISGNDDTNCKYYCSCGIDYCQAVHIRAFASDDVNMSICKYEII